MNANSNSKRASYSGVILQMRLEDSQEFIGHEWIVHDQRDGSDARVEYENGRPVEAGNFKTAARIAEKRYPGADIRLV